MHFLDEATPDEKVVLSSAWINHLKYVMIGAYLTGHKGFLAMMYGKNPRIYWEPINKKAHSLMTQFIQLHSKSPLSFELHLVKWQHMSSVIHGMMAHQSFLLDHSFAEFAQPDATVKFCNYFQITNFSELSGTVPMEHFGDWSSSDRCTLII